MSTVLQLHGTRVINAGIFEELHFTYHYLVKAAKLQCLEPVDIETSELIKPN